MEIEFYLLILITISFFLFDNHFKIFTQYLFTISLFPGIYNLIKTQTGFIKYILTYFLSYNFILKNNPFIFYLSSYLPLRRLMRCLIYYSIISFIIKPKEKRENHFIKKLYNYFKTHYFQFILLNILLFLLRLFEVYFNNNLFVYIIPKKYLLDKEENYFICANIYNNEIILPNWIEQMKKLIFFLGPEKVFISILENGDSNDKSQIYLNNFREYLNSKKIKNKIITTPIIIKKGKERIQFLSELRNKVLEPIYSLKNINKTRILFLNDIIYNYQDVIKLIGTNKRNYDVACPLDFEGKASFYDTWVSIDINGNHFINQYPYILDLISANSIINEEPLRVFSCWNGMISMKAFPLIYNNISFRFSERDNCSECTLFNADLYLNGYQKIFVNPTITLAYGFKQYYWAKFRAPLIKNFKKFFWNYYFHMKVFSNYSYIAEDLFNQYYPLCPKLKEYFNTHFLKKNYTFENTL